MNILTKRVLLIVLSILILMGVVLMILMNFAYKNDKNIKVRVDIDVPQKVEITDYVLIPGYRNEYTISVTADKPGPYDLTFSFIEEGDTDNLLKDYLYVYIEYDGMVYCNESLSELYERSKTGYSFIIMDLHRWRGEEIKVTYYIPASVGNEIQGHTVDFDMYIVAKER